MPHATVISFSEAAHTWLRIGLLSFGGPAGQISVMHRILVDEKRWIGERRFLHALSYCMLLPGPEAQQLATYIGWLLNGTRGGLIAGLLFILPGFVAMLALSFVYVTWKESVILAGVFLGLKAAVIAIVVDALLRIGRRALRDTVTRLVAVVAFGALALFDTPFPLVVIGAGLFGWVMARMARPLPTSSTNGEAKPDPGVEPVVDTLAADHPAPSMRRSLRVLAVWIPLWFAPVAACLVVAGSDSVYTKLGTFFSQMSVVTFGGAYAVLAYVAQQAVERFAWITPAQMMDGLGLAESTPGPLILVVQFVGFLAAYQVAGQDHPMLAGVIGALITVWVTFVPCFLWIFLGAPYIEALRGNASLSSVLAAIMAAVVGVIANLALWFASHVLFARVPESRVPELDSVLVVPVILTTVALLLTFALRWNLARTLACCIVLGAATAALPSVTPHY